MEITDLEIETEAQHNRKAKYMVKSKPTDKEIYEKVNIIPCIFQNCSYLSFIFLNKYTEQCV